MLEKLHPKYILTIEPYKGTKFNLVHEIANHAIATIIDIKCGERGWIAYREEDIFDPNHWDRVHTSEIKDIQEDEENNRIIIFTQNAKYILDKIDELDELDKLSRLDELEGI